MCARYIQFRPRPSSASTLDTDTPSPLPLDTRYHAPSLLHQSTHPHPFSLPFLFTERANHTRPLIARMSCLMWSPCYSYLHSFYSWRRYCNKHQIRLGGYSMNNNLSDDGKGGDGVAPAQAVAAGPGSNGIINIRERVRGELSNGERSCSPTPPKALFRSATGSPSHQIHACWGKYGGLFSLPFPSLRHPCPYYCHYLPPLSIESYPCWCVVRSHVYLSVPNKHSPYLPKIAP